MKETLNPGENFGYLRRAYSPNRSKTHLRLANAGFDPTDPRFKRARRDFARDFFVLEAQTQRDSRTGLLNRNGLENRLHEVSQRAIRHGDKFMVTYLDANDLKSINDKHPLGHAAGDELLRRIASVLNDNTRDIDHVARIGGDEFVVILDNLDGENFGAWAKRLREKLRDNDISLPLGAILLDPKSIEESIILADKLMYLAKAQSKRQKKIVDEKLRELEEMNIRVKLLKGRNPVAIGIKEEQKKTEKTS